MNRDLADWINKTDHLQGRAKPRTAPPAPGELGDIAVAVDIINASAAVVAAVTNAFFLWLQNRHTRYGHIEFEAVRPDGARVAGSVAGQEELAEVMAELARFATPPTPGADT